MLACPLGSRSLCPFLRPPPARPAAAQLTRRSARYIHPQPRQVAGGPARAGRHRAAGAAGRPQSAAVLHQAAAQAAHRAGPRPRAVQNSVLKRASQRRSRVTRRPLTPQPAEQAGAFFRLRTALRFFWQPLVLLINSVYPHPSMTSIQLTDPRSAASTDLDRTRLSLVDHRSGSVVTALPPCVLVPLSVAPLPLLLPAANASSARVAAMCVGGRGLACAGAPLHGGKCPLATGTPAQSYFFSSSFPWVPAVHAHTSVHCMPLS